jgi:hypothetical protein
MGNPPWMLDIETSTTGQKPIATKTNLGTTEGSRLTRVSSTNVLDEGLRIGEIGHRMNSKVKLVEIGVRQK